MAGFATPLSGITYYNDPYSTDGSIYTWYTWNQQYAGEATTSVITVTNSSYTPTTYAVWPIWNQQYVPSRTPEQEAVYQAEIAAAQEWQRRVQAEQIERNRIAAERQAIARDKATALLLEHLDEEQQKEFKQFKRFTVHSKNRDKQYLIEYGVAGNVKLIRDGKQIAKFCIHPALQCPTEDVMLAQKLMLETDEATFLKIANRTPLAA